jgi:signal peptidase I
MAFPDTKAPPAKRHTFHHRAVLTVIGVAGAVILVLRLFVFQPFSVPSGSMAPTLLPGDYLFASKVSYGYSRYSLPFSVDLFSGRVPSGWLPQRGDVVVFRLPRDSSVDYIKRVVGLPGDRIQMIEGVLNINGVAVPRRRIDDYAFKEDGEAQHGTVYRETLPDGISYATLALPNNGFNRNTPIYNVPPGQYFVLGDNRDNSSDSRMPSLGYIPLENIVGRAEIIYFSRAGWDRLFQVVR